MKISQRVIRSLCLFGLWLGLGLQAQAQTGTVTYVYTDPQGTPLAEADANGNVTATFDYRPYGAQALGTAPNGPGYTGHVNDPDTGLVYMQARYYDPEAGNFISIDPIGIDIGNLFSFNRYDYASNNPSVNVDPMGLCSAGADENGCRTDDSSVALSDRRPPPPPTYPEPSPKDATPLPQVKVTANPQNIGAIPPIFKIPESRPIFRKSPMKTVANKIDDFASKQIVKKASFKTLTISKEGFLEPTPFAFGIYILLHSSDLGGCDSHGKCADELSTIPANDPQPNDSQHKNK